MLNCCHVSCVLAFVPNSSCTNCCIVHRVLGESFHLGSCLGWGYNGCLWYVVQLDSTSTPNLTFASSYRPWQQGRRQRCLRGLPRSTPLLIPSTPLYSLQSITNSINPPTGISFFVLRALEIFETISVSCIDLKRGPALRRGGLSILNRPCPALTPQMPWILSPEILRRY